MSDPVALDVPALGDLPVSLYLPENVAATTQHSGGLQTTYISAAGDFTGAITVAATTTQSFYFLTGVEVHASERARAIVALGDEAVAMGGLRAMLLRPDLGGSGSKVSLKQASRAASREAEKEIILRALTRTRWNRRRAAEELQISYKALLYKLKQIGCSEYGAS